MFFKIGALVERILKTFYKSIVGLIEVVASSQKRRLFIIILPISKFFYV